MTGSLGDLLRSRFGADETIVAQALEAFADRVGALTVDGIRPRDHLREGQQSVLRSVGLHLNPVSDPDLAPVVALAVAHAQLVGRSVSVNVVAQRLGVDPSRVRQRIHARSLYAFKQGGNWLVPSFQLDDGALVPGLLSIVRALPLHLHPVAVERWFTSASSSLTLEGAPVSPVAWLRSGGAPEVCARLAAYIEAP